MAIRNKYASKRIRSNFDMAKYALLHIKDEIGDQSFKYLSAPLRDNKQLAMIELKHIDPAIEHFSKRLKNDDEIAEYIYKRKRIRWGMNYMSKRIQKKYNWICW